LADVEEIPRQHEQRLAEPPRLVLPLEQRDGLATVGDALLGPSADVAFAGEREAGLAHGEGVLAAGRLLERAPRVLPRALGLAEVAARVRHPEVIGAAERRTA